MKAQSLWQRYGYGVAGVCLPVEPYRREPTCSVLAGLAAAREEWVLSQSTQSRYAKTGVAGTIGVLLALTVWTLLTRPPDDLSDLHVVPFAVAELPEPEEIVPEPPPPPKPEPKAEPKPLPKAAPKPEPIVVAAVPPPPVVPEPPPKAAPKPEPPPRAKPKVQIAALAPPPEPEPAPEPQRRERARTPELVRKAPVPVAPSPTTPPAFSEEPAPPRQFRKVVAKPKAKAPPAPSITPVLGAREPTPVQPGPVPRAPRVREARAARKRTSTSGLALPAASAPDDATETPAPRHQRMAPPPGARRATRAPAPQLAGLGAPQVAPRSSAPSTPLRTAPPPTGATPAPNRSTPEDKLAGVPLGSLAACVSDREEDALKQKVLAAVTTQNECVSAAGRYRFLETKNLNAFLMWIERGPGRSEADRCVELALALDCLNQ